MVQNVPVMRGFTSRRRRSWISATFSILLATAWLSVADDTSSAASPIVVSLNFDNNLVNQFTLGFQDALQPAGVDATFYIDSGTVDTSNKLSWAQVGSLATSGDE